MVGVLLVREEHVNTQELVVGSGDGSFVFSRVTSGSYLIWNVEAAGGRALYMEVDTRWRGRCTI